MAALATVKGGALPADIALFALALILWRRPSWTALFVAVPIAITAAWASSWWYPVWTGARILALWVVLTEYRRQLGAVALGFVGALAIQTVGVLFFIDRGRLPGFTNNQSELGHTGVALTMLLPAVAPFGALASAVTAGSAAISLGVSVARTQILAAAVFVILARPKCWLIGVMMGALVIAVAVTFFGGYARLSPESIQAGAVNHLGTVVARDFRWFGYGYASWNDVTGQIRPHMVPVLAVYELGLLVVPIGVAIGSLIARRQIPLRVIGPLAILAAFTEEMWSMPSGQWMTAMMIAGGLARLQPQRQRDGARHGKIRAIGDRIRALAGHGEIRDRRASAPE